MADSSKKCSVGFDPDVVVVVYMLRMSTPGSCLRNKAPLGDQDLLAGKPQLPANVLSVFISSLRLNSLPLVVSKQFLSQDNRPRSCVGLLYLPCGTSTPPSFTYLIGLSIPPTHPPFLQYSQPSFHQPYPFTHPIQSFIYLPSLAHPPFPTSTVILPISSHNYLSDLHPFTSCCIFLVVLQLFYSPSILYSSIHPLFIYLSVHPSIAY